MPSSFGWVDYSEQDRQRMADFIQLFRERDTRDELGLGSIRDAFSNLFFPGTSTIQTRAKYMIFVPWIYLRHESLQTTSKDIDRKARADEIKLIEILLEREDTDGIIGKDARSRLQRLPSNIYWSGLGTWGIRLFDGSQAQYHRFLDFFYRRCELEQKRMHDEERAGSNARMNWHPGLPEPPNGFLQQASILLTKREAEYLQERILTNCSQSLLAFLIDQTSPFEGSNFVWMHPALEQFPQRLRIQVEHARNFSEVMHGAALLYNLMLGEKSGREKDSTDYRKNFTLWSEMILDRKDVLTRWDYQGEFLAIFRSEGTKIPVTTRRFVNHWINLVLTEPNTTILSTNTVAQELIRHREWEIKKSRARLHNQRALELWSGAAGAAQLDFRWRTASTIANDILIGLLKDA